MGKKLNPEDMTIEQLRGYVAHLEEGCVAPMMMREWAYDNLSVPPFDIAKHKKEKACISKLPIQFEENQIILAEDGFIYKTDITHDSYDYNRPGPKGHPAAWKRLWTRI